MNINNIPNLIDKITVNSKGLMSDKFTMVDKELFETVKRNYWNINMVPGDIVECGTWRGGYGIFLSHLFENKKIYICDSFCGFPPLNEMRYDHQSYQDTHSGVYLDRFDGRINTTLRVNLSTVIENFKKFGLQSQIENGRIEMVEGYVNDTLPKIKTKGIALLRIDVDSYSGTHEVLDHLYHKVNKGGMIIFDDLCLTESYTAIKDWMIKSKLPSLKKLEVRNPYTDEVYSLNERVVGNETGAHTGSYIIKK